MGVSRDFTFSPGTDTLNDTVIITENIDVLSMTETFHLVLSTTDQQVTTGGPATVNILDTGNSYCIFSETWLSHVLVNASQVCMLLL